MTPIQATPSAELRLREMPLRRFVQFARVALRALHGSTLLLGIVSALLLAGALLHTDTAAAKLKELSQRLLPAETETTDLADLADSEQEAAPQGLRLQAATDYVARRYRVAAPAVSPILRTVETSAREAGIDPLLVVAVIGVESGFNPLSESAMGARGLMQVIGRFHPEKVDLTADPEALLDPHTNVRVGVQVLRQYLRRTRQVEVALQSYAGAADDTDRSYARRVLAEKTRLEDYVRRVTTTRTAESARTPQT